MAKLSNSIKEAERYLQNARQILSEKAGKDGGYYSDPKYESPTKSPFFQNLF